MKLKSEFKRFFSHEDVPGEISAYLPFIQRTIDSRVKSGTITISVYIYHITVHYEVLFTMASFVLIC